MNPIIRCGATGALVFTLDVGEARANPIEAHWYNSPVLLGAAVAGGLGVAALLVWWAASGRSSTSHDVAFSEEDVTVRLDAREAIVTGLYTFRASGDAPARLGIRYPFATDTHLGEIRDIQVSDASGKRLPYTRRADAVEFDVPLQLEGPTAITVSYRQAHDGTFTYLLTSTRQWGSALDRAHFTVDVPAALGGPVSSYDLGPARPLGDVQRYETTRWGFMPDREFTLSLLAP